MRPEDKYERAKNIERVRNELGMTEESIKEDVKALQHWFRRQPQLPPITGVDEEQWLVNYLTMCKNSLTKTKSAIELYFKLRNLIPELFEDRLADSVKMEASFDATCLAFLPQLTKDGKRIVVYAHLTSDAEKFDPWTVAKRLANIADIHLYEGTQHTGLILIADLSNSRRGHLMKYPLSLINKLLTSGWNAYPERISAIHIINPTPFIETALNIFRPFLSDKLKERIIVHTSLESLLESIPVEILPSDYNGTAPSLQQLNREWQKKMIKNQAWLEESAKHRIKELKIDRNDEDLNASFRSLAID